MGLKEKKNKKNMKLKKNMYLNLAFHSLLR